MIENGDSDEQVTEYVVNLCNSLNIVTPDICEMIVPIYFVRSLKLLANSQSCTTVNANSRSICLLNLNFFLQDPVKYIKTEKPERTVYDFCGILLATSNCGNVNENLTNWEIDINDLKPPVEELPMLPV